MNLNIPEKILVGFDFSINKPACTIIEQFEDDVKVTAMFFWPLEIPDKLEELYKSLDINIRNRKLPSISKKEYKNKNNELVREHIKRARHLSGLICTDVQVYIDSKYPGFNKDNIYIATEGLSFNSRGNAALDLATYKGVFLDALSRIYNIDNIYTFSPISIKALAGCNTVEKRKRKNPMIELFKESEEAHLSDNLFHKAVVDETLKTVVNYKTGVDDLVDSYFCTLKLLSELK